MYYDEQIVSLMATHRADLLLLGRSIETELFFTGD